ncbi:MAG TPA: hypothetical protein PLC89_18845 [Haliscomenobacter sp.]|uniref:hypothetical protein n=1 Tax=Haliscomenobacter sp. TaxID=2717303 RepID=UPI002C984260|nr:hypothetical protein [Haliscomenobacter sp.]HOY19374.1 hypothetical protein [Haliscomenobacter sp.]
MIESKRIFWGLCTHHAEGGQSVPTRPNPHHPFSYSCRATPEAQKHNPCDEKKFHPRELFDTPHGYWGITFKNDDSSQHSHPHSTTTLIATSLRHTPLK